MPKCSGCDKNIQAFTIDYSNYFHHNQDIFIISKNASQCDVFCGDCSDEKMMKKIMEYFNMIGKSTADDYRKKA